MTPADLVTIVSVLAGLTCFGLYAWQTALTILAKPAAAPADAGKKAAIAALTTPGITVDEVTKLLDSMSKLTDSLAKAGPALTSLIGAILFFAIAAISSGALHSAPAPANSVPTANAPISIDGAVKSPPGG